MQRQLMCCPTAHRLTIVTRVRRCTGKARSRFYGLHNSPALSIVEIRYSPALYISLSNQIYLLTISGDFGAMAEVADLVVSIIAVIQLTGTVTSLSYGHLSGLKRAPKDLKDLVGEHGTLGVVLVELQNLADKPPGPGQQ